jgi:hypothetical protein
VTCHGFQIGFLGDPPLGAFLLPKKQPASDHGLFFFRIILEFFYLFFIFFKEFLPLFYQNFISPLI